MKRILPFLVFFCLSLQLPAQWGSQPWSLFAKFEHEIEGFDQSKAKKWTLYQPDSYMDSTRTWSLEKNGFDSTITLITYSRGSNSSPKQTWIYVKEGLRLKKKQGAWRIEEVYNPDSLYSYRYFQPFLPEIGWNRKLSVDTLILDTLPLNDRLTRTDLSESFGRWVFLQSDLTHPIRFEYNFRCNEQEMEYVGLTKKDSLWIKERNYRIGGLFPVRNDTVWLIGIDELDDSMRVKSRWNMEYERGEYSFNGYSDFGKFLRFSIAQYDYVKRIVEYEEWNSNTSKGYFERLFFTPQYQLKKYDYCIPGLGFGFSSLIWLYDSQGRKTAEKKVWIDGNTELVEDFFYENGLLQKKREISPYYMDKYGLPQKEETLIYDDNANCRTKIVVNNTWDYGWGSGSNIETLETTRYALHYEYNDQNLIERVWYQSWDTNYIAPGQPHPKVLYQFSEFEWEE